MPSDYSNTRRSTSQEMERRKGAGYEKDRAYKYMGARMNISSDVVPAAVRQAERDYSAARKATGRGND